MFTGKYKSICLEESFSTTGNEFKQNNPLLEVILFIKSWLDYFSALDANEPRQEEFMYVSVPWQRNFKFGEIKPANFKQLIELFVG